MKDINAHTHWQFGNFSPGKEHRLIYDTDKPTGAPEVEKEVKEALEKTQSLEQVQQQAGEKIKQAEGDVKQLGDKLKMLENLQNRVEKAVMDNSNEEVVFRSNRVKLKDIKLKTEIDQVKVDAEAAEKELNQEKQNTQAEVNKANADFLTAFNKLSPDQKKAFDKLKKANEKAKNAPPGSAEGQNIIMAIIEAILEWIQSASDKDKDKDKDKGPKGPNDPKGPENNNQPPPKQESPELSAVRKEVEDSDYRTVYDNAKNARDRAKAKLDTGVPPATFGLRKALALDEATKVDKEKAVRDAQEAVDENDDPTQADILKKSLEDAQENLRTVEARITSVQKEIEHYENEYQVNKDKVDLMDGAKEVAEKEAEEMTKGLQRVAAEIGTVDNPNEQALHDAVNGITVNYKADTLDDVQFAVGGANGYVEAEWDKVKAVAKDMGLNSAAFEVDNDGVIKNPSAFNSELLAVAQRLDAGAESQVATIKEMTDAGVDQSVAESAFEIRQKYGVEFKVNAGRVQVEGGADNAKKAFLAFRKEGGVTGTSLDTHVVKAVEDHIKSALADITTPEGRAVVEAGFIPNTAKAHEQLVQLAQDPEMGGFKSGFAIDDAGTFYRPPTPDFKDKIVNSELYKNGKLDPQILAMYS